MALTQAEQKFLAGHRLGTLATVGADGGPDQPGLRTRDIGAAG